MRRVLPLVGALLAFLGTMSPSAARATTEGLTVRGYPLDDPEALCAETVVPSLNLSWGGGDILGCGPDRVRLVLTGSLYSPGPTYSYLFQSDDGIRIRINGQLISDQWWDRGCSGYVLTPQLATGWHTLEIEYYENGGGTCLVGYQRGPEGWSLIPSNYLSTEGPSPVPTTSSTTVPETTTTTSTTSSTTTVPETTTTYLVSTTSTTSIQTAQTSPTPVQSPTTYQPIVSIPTPSTTQAVASTSTALSIPESTMSLQPTTTVESIAPTSSTTTAIITPDTLVPTPVAPTTTDPPDTQSPTPGEALAIATNPATVAKLTEEEAEAVFSAIDESSLTPEAGALLVAAVQNAPTAVRKAFESEINVFGGATDTYIPLGSSIPVKERRVVIAATALVASVPPPRRRI